MIPSLPTNIPIVDEEGKMTAQFNLFVNALLAQQTYIGAGTPENVVEAQEKAHYIDTAGSTGSVLYVKQKQSISGDRTQGWILV